MSRKTRYFAAAAIIGLALLGLFVLLGPQNAIARLAGGLGDGVNWVYEARYGQGPSLLGRGEGFGVNYNHLAVSASDPAGEKPLPQVRP